MTFASEKHCTKMPLDGCDFSRLCSAVTEAQSSALCSSVAAGSIGLLSLLGPRPVFTVRGSDVALVVRKSDFLSGGSLCIFGLLSFSLT